VPVSLWLPIHTATLLACAVQVLTDVDQLNAIASAAYSALQAQASKTDSTARGLKQTSGGFVPVADLQAVFAAISRVSVTAFFRSCSQARKNTRPRALNGPNQPSW